MIESDPKKLEESPILFTIVAYYLYAEQDFNRLFLLLQKTKTPEFLALKAVALLKINRFDLAEGVLR